MYIWRTADLIVNRGVLDQPGAALFSALNLRLVAAIINTLNLWQGAMVGHHFCAVCSSRLLTKAKSEIVAFDSPFDLTSLYAIIIFSFCNHTSFKLATYIAITGTTRRHVALKSRTLPLVNITERFFAAWRTMTQILLKCTCSALRMHVMVNTIIFLTLLVTWDG